MFFSFFPLYLSHSDVPYDQRTGTTFRLSTKQGQKGIDFLIISSSSSSFFFNQRSCLACTELWSQPHPSPLGWTIQVLSINIWSLLVLRWRDRRKSPPVPHSPQPLVIVACQVVCVCVCVCVCVLCFPSSFLSLPLPSFVFKRSTWLPST